MVESPLQCETLKLKVLPIFIDAQTCDSVICEKVFAKRVLRSNSGIAYIRHAGSLWQIGLGANSEILVRIPNTPIEAEPIPSPESFEYALPYFVAPATVVDELTNSAWRFVINSFYTILEIRAPIEILEGLVNRLLLRKVNIVSWDETDISEYPYVVKFSRGLAVDRIKGVVTEFFANEAKDIQLRLLKAEMGRLQDLTSTSVSMALFEAMHERSLENKTQDDRDALELAFAEISELEAKISEQEELISGLRAAQMSAFKKLKRSEIEKMLGYLLVSLFPNIAVAPESVCVLKERFVKSKSIWRLLGQLNKDASINFKSLQGLASKVGWKEAQEHIGTGSDSRGRLYFRRSKYEHFYDVVLHWKKNDVEQNRVVKKLATYEYFESPQVVL